MELAAVLMSLIPDGEVVVDGEIVDVTLPGVTVTSFELVDENLDQIAPRARSRLPLAVVDSGGRAAIERLRAKGVSFVVADGSAISLRAPGLYVEVSGRPRGSDGDRVRNPFSPRALGVALQFLLAPDRAWTVSELARAATVSASFTSRVVAGLREEGLVLERTDGLRAEPSLLFAAMGREWPRPRAFFLGRAPSRNETVLGGGPAYDHYGLSVGGRPRAYTASRDQLRMLVTTTVSSPATGRLADWESVPLPLPVMNGYAPEAIVALELAGDPRGREVLRESRLVPWEVVG